jgi:integrase
MDAAEMDRVLRQYEIGSDRWAALSLHGRCGLKTKEVLRISPSDIVEDHDPMLLEVDTSGQLSRRRGVPIPRDLAATLKIRGDNQSSGSNKSRSEEPVINVNPRTIREWSKAHVNKLIKIFDDEDWRHLSPRSFRHSWADILLNDGIPPQIVMRWGGWNDSSNFHNLYISDHRESDFTQIYDSDIFNTDRPRYLDE